MEKHEVQKRIEGGLPGTRAQVSEFSGGNDHYAVTVVSEAFEGQTLLKRHRMVMDLFQAEIASGEVHALTLKTLTPQQYENEVTKT